MKKSDLKTLKQILTPFKMGRTNIPVLGCALFESYPALNETVIRATDLDVELKIILPHSEGFDGLVKWDTIQSELKAPVEEISLPLADDKPEDFPPEMELGNKPLSSISSKSFSDILNNAVKFMSEDQTRYVLNGVHFVPTDIGYNVESSDGKRLLDAVANMGEYRYRLHESVENFIIPAKAVVHLSRLLKTANADLTMTFDDRTNVYSFSSRLKNDWRFAVRFKPVAGNFPNVKIITKPGYEAKIFKSFQSGEKLLTETKYRKPAKSAKFETVGLRSLDFEWGVDASENLSQYRDDCEFFGFFQGGLLEDFFTPVKDLPFRLYFSGNERPIFMKHENCGVKYLSVLMPFSTP